MSSSEELLLGDAPRSRWQAAEYPSAERVGVHIALDQQSFGLRLNVTKFSLKLAKPTWESPVRMRPLPRALPSRAAVAAATYLRIRRRLMPRFYAGTKNGLAVDGGVSAESATVGDLFGRYQQVSATRATHERLTAGARAVRAREPARTSAPSY